ncbi:hypothetical protein [Maricaulis sp.]|uniref:WD40 repeat domain-containing protein n=1 Tax=Maricaulis sp. TaxID=1486257 RepID=UPI00262E7952|nr:hypothetical protein [Maricaulis sp.]
MIKTTKLAATTLLASALATQAAQAQRFEYAIQVAGIPVQCQTADGQQVAISLDDALYQNIGMADFNDATGEPYIRISPRWLNEVPPQAAMFWFYHECAHLNLPRGVGTDSPYREINADCWAINRMYAHGFIRNYGDVQAIAGDVGRLPGSSTHLPGPARVQSMLQCAIPGIPMMARGGTARTSETSRRYSPGDRYTQQTSEDFVLRAGEYRLISNGLDRSGSRPAAREERPLRTVERWELLASDDTGPGAYAIDTRPGGSIVAAGDGGGGLSFYNRQTRPSELRGEDDEAERGSVLAIEFDRSGDAFLVVGSAGKLEVHRITDGGRTTYHQSSDSNALADGTISPDGQLVAIAGSDRYSSGFAEIRDDNGSSIRAFLRTENNEPVGHLQFGPAGDRIAGLLRNGDIVLWDAPSGDRLLTIVERSFGAGTALDIAPQGRLIAAGYDSGILALHDRTLARETEYVIVGQEEVSALSFSPDGRFLAAGSYDGVLRVWSVGSELESWWRTETGFAVTDLAFNDEGNRLYVTGADGSVQTWTR